jgi:hypothetical protein
MSGQFNAGANFSVTVRAGLIEDFHACLSQHVGGKQLQDLEFHAVFSSDH